MGKTVRDDGLYKSLDVPMSKEAADAAVNAFVDALEKLRVEHKIPDIAYGIRMNVDGNDAVCSGWRGSQAVVTALIASMYGQARCDAVKALDRVAGIGVKDDEG